MNYYFAVFKKYAEFTGRARRAEYWYFQLFHFLALLIFAFLGFAIFGEEGGLVLYLLYILVSLVPALALSVRRMHDINKSGWYILISIIPLIGGIWFLVLSVTEGDHGSNQYGPDPKGSPNFDIDDFGLKEEDINTE